jgi:hypothetical protein
VVGGGVDDAIRFNDNINTRGFVFRRICHRHICKYLCCDRVNDVVTRFDQRIIRETVVWQKLLVERVVLVLDTVYFELGCSVIGKYIVCDFLIIQVIRHFEIVSAFVEHMHGVCHDRQCLGVNVAKLATLCAEVVHTIAYGNHRVFTHFDKSKPTTIKISGIKWRLSCTNTDIVV